MIYSYIVAVVKTNFLLDFPKKTVLCEANSPTWLSNNYQRDFPGGPVAKTLYS